jgi:hypothetical protein
VIARGSPKELIAEHGPPPRTELLTVTATLEDVFVFLTGRHLRDD